MLVDAQKAEEILGHPLGKRQTDDKLALAAILGHLGRARYGPSELNGGQGAITEGLEQEMRARRGSIWQRLRSLVIPAAPITRRRWPLIRKLQIDQDGEPACVGATENHWELSQPIQNRKGLGWQEMYRRAKLIDRWPGQDGTDATAMLTVCQELGMVESFWWWTGPSDTPAASDWLLHIGPLWLGAFITESMFRTDAKGMVEVSGEFRYGHEMLLIERDTKKKLWGGVQSWGNDHYGLQGRWWIRDEDFDRLMAAGGDLIGVVEKRL